jgi:rhamnogalacturonyl hydrolase YesR
MARAINNGWIDAMTYGSQVILGWHALTTKVNELGEVEGTCVGTGMGFDPAFYYYRPRNKHAGHGYGPVIFAGAEMYRLLSTHHIKMNDSAVLFYKERVDTDEPIFYLE